MRVPWQRTACNAHNAFVPGKAVLELFTSPTLPERWARRVSSEATQPNYAEENSTSPPSSQDSRNGQSYATSSIPENNFKQWPGVRRDRGKVAISRPPWLHDMIFETIGQSGRSELLHPAANGTPGSSGNKKWILPSDYNDLEKRRVKLQRQIGRFSLKVRGSVAKLEEKPEWLAALRTAEQRRKDEDHGKHNALEYEGVEVPQDRDPSHSHPGKWIAKMPFLRNYKIKPGLKAHDKYEPCSIQSFQHCD